MPDNQIPPKITPDQYDKLLRKLWEIEQKISCFNNITKHQEDINDLYAQNAKIMAEQKLIKKMCIKIGTKLFKKAADK